MNEKLTELFPHRASLFLSLSSFSERVLATSQLYKLSNGRTRTLPQLGVVPLGLSIVSKEVSTFAPSTRTGSWIKIHHGAPVSRCKKVRGAPRLKMASKPVAGTSRDLATLGMGCDLFQFPPLVGWSPDLFFSSLAQSWGAHGLFLFPLF